MTRDSTQVKLKNVPTDKSSQKKSVFKSAKLSLDVYRRVWYARKVIVHRGFGSLSKRMQARITEALEDHSDVPRHRGTIGMTTVFSMAMDLLFDVLEVTWPPSDGTVVPSFVKAADKPSGVPISAGEIETLDQIDESMRDSGFDDEEVFVDGSHAESATKPQFNHADKPDDILPSTTRQPKKRPR